MTPPELLSMMRLLSAVESALMMSEKPAPDHVYDDLTRHVWILEREILAGTTVVTPGAWQPVATAPLDDAVLVYLHRVDSVTTGHKSEEGQWWSEAGNKWPTSEISHWMLLPEPPKV